METGTLHIKRLYKSRRDRMIDGVCAGVAEYFGVDPTILRILWVLSIFIGGIGFFLYIAGMIIMPANPEHLASPEIGAVVKTSHRNQRFWGMMLIVLGLCILLTNLGVLGFLHMWHISWTFLFAVFLITMGFFLIFRSPVVQGQPPASEAPGSESGQQSHFRRLERTRKDKKLLGVCGGIAKYFNIDPSIVRIMYVFFIFISHGIGILIYFVLGLILPEEELQPV
ncbi:MAG: PspC domain-containing protein [Bacteroidota bacterium]